MKETDTNLFDPAVTQGNLAEVEFVAKILGRVVVFIISIVGLGITLATISKNALAALFAVNPRFWNKVDEAHKSSLGKSEGGNQITKVVGSLVVVVLNLFPNIKELTDFADEDIDIKGYFYKAVPLACVQIFVGVFVFFGYPARVAEKFSEFGTGVLDVVLTNVDPKAWVESLPTKLFSLRLSTDGSNADIDKAVNKAAKSVYKTYVSELTDMTKEKRNDVSHVIEQWCIDNMNALPKKELIDSDKFKMSVNARIHITQPDLSYVNGKEVEGVYTFAYTRPIADWDSGSTMKESMSKWIRYDLVFTPVAQKGVSSSINCVAKGGTWVIGKKKITITLDSSTATEYGLTGSSTLNGKAVAGTKEYNLSGKVAGNTVTYTCASNMDVTKITEVKGVGGLYYSYGESQHPIKKLIKGSGTATFTPVTPNPDLKSWKWGQDPVKKLKSATASTGNKKSESTSQETDASTTLGGKGSKN